MKKKKQPEAQEIRRAGRIIVLEGIDGAGGETQSKMLFEYMKNIGHPVEKLHYPDYFGPIGKLIKDFLYKRFELQTEIQFLLYFSDFLKDKEKITKLVNEGTTVIMDRYFTSTLAYQISENLPVDKAIRIAKFFEIPRPDIIIYLKISPETSYRRKIREKGLLDRHELDRELLARKLDTYDYLVKNNVFGKWVLIDGEKTKEEVFADVKKALLID